MDFTKKRLDPYLISLTEDACLKAFNRKTALKKFFIQHESDKFDVPQYDCITRKRAYLSDVFMQLSEKNDAKSHLFIFNIASSLVSMNSFPDLSGWEDSKEKIAAAYRAREKLKIEFDKISELTNDEKVIKQRKRLAEKEKAARDESCRKFNDIRSKFNSLLPSIGTQKAGYDFEEWFYLLVDYFEIVSRRPYKDLHGRQIDGSLTLYGITYLVELKFRTEPIGSQEIDIFLGKVTRKAENTMGIIVSMSGYNTNAIQTASRDRTPLLLMDYSHIVNIILPQIMTLDEVIGRINRHAAQTGCAYLPAKDFNLT